MALVYALIAKSNPDELRYIGKTCDSSPKGRYWSHINEAKKSPEQTYKLNWIRKVLRSNDKVLVITLEDSLTEQQSFERETYLIAYYRAYGDRITNATNGGEGSSGYKHTEESKAKLRKPKSEEAKANMCGIPKSEKHKATLSAARTGVPLSEEHKASLRAKANTEEYRAKQRVAHTGKTHTEESKARMRIVHTGKKFSEEHKANISAAKKGKKRSEEFKANLSAAKKGKPGPKPSEETKAKLRESKLKYWEQKRRDAA